MKTLVIRAAISLTTVGLLSAPSAASDIHVGLDDSEAEFVAADDARAERLLRWMPDRG